MDGALIAGGCVVIVALIVVAAIVSAKHERRRRDGLRAWAAGHGWTYEEQPATDWPSRLPGRDRRGVSLVLSGVVDGHPVSVAEYSYTQRSTSTDRDADGRSSTRTSSTTYHFVVVVVRLPQPGPSVEVEPRHALSKLGRAIFGDRATAIGDERFDGAFRIGADDPTTARRLVGPTLASEHLAGRVPAWSLVGHELLTYHTGRIESADRLPELAAPLIRVATLLGR